MNVLVIDVGGTNIKILATGRQETNTETFHLLAALFHSNHRHILELDESLIRLQEGFCYDYSSLF
jgi:hexokinase